MNEEMKKYCRERMFVKGGFILINALCIYLLIKTNMYIVTTIAISMSIIAVSWLLFVVVNLKLLKRFDSILLNDCDSDLFHSIYQTFAKKYRKDSVIIEKYAISLLHKEDHDAELKRFVRIYNKNYKKQLYYLRASYVIASEEEKKEKFDVYYNATKTFFEKRYDKTKADSWKIGLLFVEAEKAFLYGDYEKALSICQSIPILQTNLDKVKKEFLLGECLFQLGRTKEALVKYDYVIKHANTLRMCALAKKMKLEID